MQWILLYLIVESNWGQIKVESMFDEDDQSWIKVLIYSEETFISKDDVNRINKVFTKNEFEVSKINKLNLTVLKELIDNLKGKLHISIDNSSGVCVTFVFNAELKDGDTKFEKAGDVSDCDSPKDLVKCIPSMNWSNHPLAKYNEELSLSQLKINCWPSILIVDDTYFNIEVLQSMIEKLPLNFSWDSAENGLEGLNKVKERFSKSWCTKYYDFIFTDINMPIMDGYVECSEIKKFLFKELVTLVVIYLGHSSLYLGHSSLYHGHSSPISDTRHLSWTLVTYLGHLSPILDTRHLSWTLVTYLGHSSPILDTRHLSWTLVTYLGHSSPILDTRHLSWTLVTYLGHSSPILDTRHLSWTLVTYLGHSSPILDTCHLSWTLVTYLGHSSPILDTRHLSWTLVTYLGHSSPILDIFYYMHNYFYNRK